ncbi:MAG: ATP-grasp domain-containing protein [Candidatus Micrarchaeia archaeon]
MKRILVCSAGGAAAINFVDSLRMEAEKMFIVGADCNKWHLENSDSNVKYVVPRCNQEGYLKKLNEIIYSEKVEFVHPQSDSEVRFLSENREKVNAKTFLPDKKTVEICQDKAKCVEILRANNVGVPRTACLEDLRVEEAFSRLKLEKAWVRATRGAGSRAALPVNSAGQAQNWINYWVEFNGFKREDFMISEFLPGREYAFQSIWKNGEIVTSQARERLEYIFGNLMPSGQTSSPSVARSVHNNQVNETAERAVRAIDKNASGVFCVDLKENALGVPCVTEINSGRFFTTSNFFSKAGANMPFTYLKLAFGQEVKDVSKYNVVPEGFYWIRVVDKYPVLLRGEQWTSKNA